jgi:NAD+ kinase
MKRIGLVAARSKEEAWGLARDVEAWLQERGCEVVHESALEADGGSSVDAILVLGGDGLMMRSANHFPDRPLLGINFGKVGFLAVVERRDWQRALTELLEGRYTIQEGSTLAASLTRGDRTIDHGWAINYVVVRSGLRMVDVELYIDGQYVKM